MANIPRSTEPALAVSESLSKAICPFECAKIAASSRPFAGPMSYAIGISPDPVMVTFEIPPRFSAATALSLFPNIS